MLNHKKWITVTVLAAALVMLLGVVAGVAYGANGTANTANTTATDPAQTLYTKVAAILGIDQQKLEAAYTQARQEIHDEELTCRLKSMVEQGTITQTQADAYLKWWQSRPDVASQLGFGGGMGIPGGPHGMQGPGGNAPPAPTDTANTK